MWFKLVARAYCIDKNSSVFHCVTDLRHPVFTPTSSYLDFSATVLGDETEQMLKLEPLNIEQLLFQLKLLQ